jgi:hypothetical protein
VKTIQGIFSFILLAIIFSTCRPSVKDDAVERGEALAMQWCQSCHAFPEPSLLDKQSWEAYILPRMGYFLGIYPDSVPRESLIEPNYGGVLVERAGIYPKERLIDLADWEAIQAFYLESAPDSLILPPRPDIPRNLDLFETRISKYRSVPSTTLARFHESGFFIGDAARQSIMNFDEDLNLRRAAKVDEGAVWINETPEGDLVTVMGNFLPTDEPLGYVVYFQPGKGPKVLADSLQRPVHTAVGDLDGDSLIDFVTCEFGKWTGALSWFRNEGNGTYSKRTLRAVPGAIKSEIRDLDGNGTPDIAALFGQGDEGIWAFLNDGTGNFQAKRLLQFSSSWGSSSFEWVDMNDDGLDDIVYCNGDNADFGPVLKPYHGIRIFFNKGNMAFEEGFFYPLNGAYAAKPGDYDLDGDLDIAVISFFPDYAERPEESFVYLENQGKWNFTPSTIKNPLLGRWIVMDAGDPDKDGDLDLILGSLNFEVVPKSGLNQVWAENQVPFIFMENMSLPVME